MLLSITSFSFGQTVSGTVYDKTTKEPIPFTNVSIKGTSMGTVSNSQGYFKLTIPSECTNCIMACSFIGYKPETFSIKNVNKNITVYLEKQDILLSEVSIRPDSNLFTLLKRAYKNIPLNYANEPSLLNGFYRESLKEKNGPYLYMAEAVINSYVTSYHNSQQGQVEILKSRKNIMPGADTINRVKYYGGVFVAHTDDVVHNRTGAINPKNFKKYTYNYLGMQPYGDRLVYSIAYSAADSNINGTFYIDNQSLAYVYFEYEKIGSWKSSTPAITEKRVNRKMLYTEIDGVWFLKSSSDKREALNNHSGKMLELFNDYVTTNYSNQSINPISFDNQVAYTDIFSDLATNYDESYWKDYTILEQDSLTTNQLELQFTNNESQQLLTKEHKTEPSGIDKLLRIAQKISFAYAINFNDYQFPIKSARLVFSELEVSNNNINKAELNLGFYSTIGYNIYKRLSLTYAGSSSLMSNVYQNTQQFGAAYLICLKPGGRQFFAIPAINYYYTKSGYLLGSQELAIPLVAGGKTFESGSINVYTGKKYSGVSTGLSFKTKLGAFTNLLVGGNYYFPVTISDGLILKENGGLFKKEAYVPFDDTLEYYEDGKRKTSNSFGLANWNVFVGIRFEL